MNYPNKKLSDFDNGVKFPSYKTGHIDHELYSYAGLDHWNTLHTSPGESFTGKKEKWDVKQPEMVIK